MTEYRKHATFEPGTVCFYLDDEDNWRIARIDAVQGEDAKRIFLVHTSDVHGTPDPDGRKAKVPLDKLAPLEEDWLEPVRDLLQMVTLHDSLLLQQIRSRYWQDIIYTNIGPIVLALNPYNYKLPLYTDDNMPRYIEERAAALHGGSRLPTHSWSVAHDAYWSMAQGHQAQSILVSGESGAGKTEAAKIVTNYLAKCSTHFSSAHEREQARAITDKIQNASPILEAFGNAKTLRNDNSSRFGKFMKLQFNRSGFLHGCYTINYLLEKSRVVGHAVGERCYHTFYQLAAGASPQERDRYHLHDVAQFEWLYHGVPRNAADTEADSAEYQVVRRAFSLVGFSEEEIDAIYRVVAGIMHLQSTKFLSNRDKAELSKADLEKLGWVCELWQTDAEVMYKELISTTNTVRGDTFTIQHTVAQASEVRDGLSKSLYERTFQFIVNRLNDVLDREAETEKHAWIGLLDIFGFENFEKNFFEQLCINFANEQLQHHYNTCVFQRDLEEYAQEGINTESIDPPNNKPTLDLIGASMGVFQLLSDQAKGGNDEKFMNMLFEKHARHKMLRKPRIQNGTFGIQHYAGEVWYIGKGMRDKNLDPLKDSLRLLLRASEHPVIKDLLEPCHDDKRGVDTVAKFFQNSLQQLITMIDMTNPHWIRCVKPHSAKKPRMFHGNEVMTQLRCAGVLETVKIRQTGYSLRLRHADFWNRFKLLLVDPGVKLSDKFTQADLKQILDRAKLSAADAQIGRTKVFLKDPPYRVLEGLRNHQLDHLAVAVQRFAAVKVSYGLAHARRLRNALIRIQQCAKSWSSQYHFRLVELAWWKRRIGAAMLLQRLSRARLAAQVAHRRRLLRWVAQIQAACRAQSCVQDVRKRLQLRKVKTVQSVRLLQRFMKGKASELIYQEKGEELVDQLSAEAEVMRELEEERRRLEAARREALKARIRAEKGLPAAPPPEEVPVAAEPPAEAEAEAQPPEPQTAPAAPEAAPALPAAAPEPAVRVPSAEAVPRRPSSFAEGPDEEAFANALLYDSAKIQASTQLEVQLKKQARQLGRMELQLQRTYAQLTAREKECAELKTQLQHEESARRTTEAALERERLQCKLLQQRVAELSGQRSAEREKEAELIKTAIDHPELLHEITDAKRKEIGHTWERLELLENDLVHLCRSAILHRHCTVGAEMEVKKELDTLKQKFLAHWETPKEVFHTADLVRRVKDVMRDTATCPEVHRLLMEFCRFSAELDKSIAGTNCLPRDELVQPLRKPLELLQQLMVIVARKKLEEQERVSLQGLDPPVPAFAKNTTLDKLRRFHEAGLRKFEDREYTLQLKVLKMEEMTRDVNRLTETLGDLEHVTAELHSLRSRFEEACAALVEEDRQLKRELHKYVTEQTEPPAAVIQKKEQKEQEIARLRQSVRQRQADIQEDFLRLLNAEETVACIQRDMGSMGQMRADLEVDIARLREVAQHRVVGLEGGVMLALKEQRLVTDLRAIIQQMVNELAAEAWTTMGHTQELNLQLIQKHSQWLETYYNDILQLLHHQRQQLAEEEANLAAGGKAKGISYYLMSQDRAHQRQQELVNRRRQDIIHTHEVLKGIKERFCLLYHFSNALRVAEFLAKYDRSKYGALLSTNTMQDPLESFSWPELTEVLLVERDAHPDDSGSGRSSGSPSPPPDK